MVMGGVNIALRVITMVSSVLLMRVLDVDDFGIVGAAMIVLYTTNLFAGLGLTFALIQSQAPRGQVAFQSFVVTSSAGAVLCLLILANINPLAALLGKAEIAPILAWLAPLVFIGGLAMVPEALLQKQMLFNRMSVVVIAGELTYVGLALAFAYSGFGIWSLVYAALTKSVLILVLDWILTPGWEWITPKPWDGKLMKKLLSFGLQSTGGGVTTFIYSLIDNFTVTRWLGTTQLSYYQKSFDFTSRTVDGLNNVISSVLLPSYALIQSERDRLSRAYLKSLRLISFIIVPVAMGMLIVAPEMVMTFLTDKWSPMVVPFQILCVVSMVKPLSATTSVLFTSVGHPGYNFRAGLVVIAVLVPMIVLLLPYGIVGVAFAVLTAQVLGFAYNMFQVTRILHNTASRMPAAIAPSLLAAGLMMVAVALIKAPVQSLAGGAHTPWSVAGLIVVGGGVYMTTLALIQRSSVREIADLALNRFRSKVAKPT
jgi:O-antigen/teichoic acid export membrane protein